MTNSLETPPHAERVPARRALGVDPSVIQMLALSPEQVLLGTELRVGQTLTR